MMVVNQFIFLLLLLLLHLFYSYFPLFLVLFDDYLNELFDC